MLAWYLGWRYLRKRRTAWLAFAAITLTVAVPVAVVGVTQGFLDVTARQVRANESDLTVSQRWVDGGIPDLPRVRERITSDPGVVHLAPFISVYGLLVPKTENSDGNNGVPIQIDAIDWGDDTAIGRLDTEFLHPPPVESLSAPPMTPSERGTGFLTPDWRAHLALSGLDLASAFGVSPLPLPPRQRPAIGIVTGREVLYGSGIAIGSPVQLVASNGTKVQAEVSDTLGTGVLEIDRYAVLLPLSYGQILAGYQGKGGRPKEVGGYRLKATDSEPLRTVANRLSDKVGLRVLTWEARRGNLIMSLKQQRNVIGLVMILIQCITVFIVYAVFSTLVVEKRHDIGVLLGLGVRRGVIASSFLLAGVACCLLGGVAGWALGWGALAGLNPLSKWLNVPLFPQDVFYTPNAPTSFDPLIPLLFIAIMTVVGLIAVALPAWRASRIQPVEILREGA